MNAGIYLITCKHPSGRDYYYVGQTSNFKRRVAAHLTKLRNGNHHNRMMQFFWNKHGASVFEISMIAECSKEQLDEHEQWWLQQMVGYERVFNYGTAPGAAMRGRKFTKEHREKISKALTGIKRQPLSEERKQACSQRFKGTKWSDERRAALSERQRGVNHHTYGKPSYEMRNAVAVIGVCIRTGVEIRYGSMQCAAKDGFLPSCISACCAKRKKTHLGYRWAKANIESR